MMPKEEQPYVIPAWPQVRRMLAIFVLPVIVLMIVAFSLAYFLMPPAKQAPTAPQASQQPQNAPAKNNEPVSCSAY